MLSSLIKNLRPEKGQVVVFMVLLLPLILGVVVLVIELGNVYVHYSELQNIADTAAITGNISSAKEVIKQNVKNLSGKGKVADSADKDSNADFLVKIYRCPDAVNSSSGKFFVKLEKNVPVIFIKVFNDRKVIQVMAYAAGSTGSEKKLLPITQTEMNNIKNFKSESGEYGWTFEPVPEEP